MGKALELPNNIEMRNYRITNTSQLKLWSVEDQKLDRDTSLSRGARTSTGGRMEPQLSPVDSKEMDVKDIEQQKPCKPWRKPKKRRP